jgi:hypothetical protein
MIKDGVDNGAFQVKQYVAVVQNNWGNQFMVFRTGDDRFYLFVLMDSHGCLTELQFPVRKSDLRPEIRIALAHGWGNGILSLAKIGLR